MNQVMSVSFPRSGHALTTELLRAYFGPALIYSGEGPGRNEWKPGSNFLKTHDFDLEVPIHRDRHYIVQIRNVVDSMWSWHQLTVKLDGIPDTIGTYRELFRSKLRYWTRFVDKWVLSDIPNRTIIRYTDLVNSPEKALSRAVRVFGEEPQMDRILLAVKSVNISSRGMPEFYL